jgi:Ca2+/Na+ antiporter
LAHAIGATGVASGFALFLVCLFVGLSALFLTLEMIVRSAAVYVAVLFLPLALTGLVWPATAKWGKRLAELLAVLIVSKFVVVAIISMAIPAVAAGSTASGLGGLLSGAALLFLAGVAPFTLLRMVPVIEAGVVGHLEGAGRRPLAAVPLSSRDVVQHVIQQQQRQQEQHSAPDPAPGPLSGRPSAERFGDVDSRMEQAADGTLGGPGRPVPAGGLIGGVGPSGSAAVGEAGSAAGGGAAGGAGAGGAAAAGLATAGVGAAAAATTSAARSARSALADPAGELAQLGGGDE